jgi:hypothetical protein
VNRALVCALLTVAAARAQETPPLLRIDVNRVQVDATVTDAKGRPVTDLKAADFEVQ